MLASVRSKPPFCAVKKHLRNLFAIERFFLTILQFFLFLVFFLFDSKFKVFGRCESHWKRKLGLVLGAGENFVHWLDRFGGRGSFRALSDG